MVLIAGVESIMHVAQYGCTGGAIGGIDAIKHSPKFPSSSSSHPSNQAASLSRQVQDHDSAVGRISAADQVP